jgi:hypothetical protein
MKRWTIPVVFLLIGMVLLHAPMLREGAGRVHGNMVDGRLVALLLEHAHQWLMGRAPSLFHPTWLFYPYPNALALTDTMLGATILYSPFRWMGASPLHAFQLWLVCCALFGYGAVYRLARHLGLASLGASVAAFVVTFGMPRVTAAHHPQLAFFLPIPMLLLAGISAVRTPSPRYRVLATLAAALTLAWQFWSVPYLGFFLLLALVIAGVSFLFLSDLRRALLTEIRRRPGTYALLALGAGGLFLLCMAPLVRATLFHGSLLQRPWAEVATYLPTPTALIFPHGGSLIYGWAHDRLVPFITNTGENQLFAGLVILFTPFASFLLLRRGALTPMPRALGVVLLAVWATLTLIMLGDRSGHSLWWFVHLLPGGSGIRAVGRLGFITLFCSALMLGQILTWLEQRSRGRWVFVLAAFVVLEGAVDNRYQFSIASHQQRVTALKQDLEALGNCNAFVYSWPKDDFKAYAIQLDAMWASHETGIPTVNGWAGANPAGWNFRGQSFSQEDAVAWMRRFRPEFGRMCVLSAEGGPTQRLP